MNLPITLIPDTNPPRFRWQQPVSGWGVDDSLRVVDCEGTVPASLEGALIHLIGIATRLTKENWHLKQTVQGLAERVAAQSDLLSKRAEAATPKGKR